MTIHSRVVPAILTEGPQALETMVRQVETFTSYAQIDIMDGQFVPSRSITWEDIAPLAIKFAWEAHLMTLRPEEQFQGYRQAGAQKVVFHYEATPSPQKVIGFARDLGLKVGLAINPDTPVSAIRQLASQVDSVLLLSVDPGFYGSPYIPEVVDKVAELRQLRPDLEIGMDGGIKAGNIAAIAKAGVDTICVGSAIFLQPHPDESFRHLQSLIQDAL